jgi:hypothetical protein
MARAGRWCLETAVTGALMAAFDPLRTMSELDTSSLMETVFVLHHVRADDEFGDDAKLIGVYRSEGAVADAIARLSRQPGFRDHPNGFQSGAYRLDEDNWVEGFVSL